MITYYAYDVETANYLYSSICQIGIVKFEDGVPVHTWNFLVNPGSDWFCFSGIHGITYGDVKDAPLFQEIYHEVKNIVGDNIVIHHTPFDVHSTKTACEVYNLPPLDFSHWIDSARIVRRTFPEFEKSGYGLANVAKHLNIEFAHHDAAEDAKAAGLIAWECSKIKDIDFNQWSELVTQPIHSIDKRSFDQPNPDGDLYGEGITFTGTLSIPRNTAIEANTEQVQEDSKIVTTEEEIEAYYIVKSILRNHIQAERVTFRDAQSYFAIFCDDNNRKPICRLYFNTANKYIGIFDADKKRNQT